MGWWRHLAVVRSLFSSFFSGPQQPRAREAAVGPLGARRLIYVHTLPFSPDDVKAGRPLPRTTLLHALLSRRLRPQRIPHPPQLRFFVKLLEGQALREQDGEESRASQDSTQIDGIRFARTRLRFVAP